MVPPFTHVCVFCGASAGNRPEYARAADELGREIARREMTLVYGGGSVGLMGCVADGALACGGRVIGVITEQLHDKELGHRGIAELRVVRTMHERKMAMATLAGAFVVLPGGFGTLDEMFEIIAWAQLGLHDKPVGLLDVGGYFDAMMQFLDHAGREGFLRISHREQVVCRDGAAALIDALGNTRGMPRGIFPTRTPTATPTSAPTPRPPA